MINYDVKPVNQTKYCQSFFHLNRDVGKGNNMATKRFLLYVYLFIILFVRELRESLIVEFFLRIPIFEKS